MSKLFWKSMTLEVVLIRRIGLNNVFIKTGYKLNLRFFIRYQKGSKLKTTIIALMTKHYQKLHGRLALLNRFLIIPMISVPYFHPFVNNLPCLLTNNKVWTASSSPLHRSTQILSSLKVWLFTSLCTEIELVANFTLLLWIHVDILLILCRRLNS